MIAAVWLFCGPLLCSFRLRVKVCSAEGPKLGLRPAGATRRLLCDFGWTWLDHGGSRRVRVSTGRYQASLARPRAAWAAGSGSFGAAKAGLLAVGLLSGCLDGCALAPETGRPGRGKRRRRYGVR
jgi:hypothetical protein